MIFRRFYDDRLAQASYLVGCEKAGGDRITVGMVHMDMAHTPGHTPEHLTFLVTDCGKAMSSAAQSTLGYERIANWALQPMSEHDFVEQVMQGQPGPPPYFGAMKRRNRDGVAAASGSLPRNVAPGVFAAAAHNHTFLIDVRNRDEWDGGYIDGATLIPLPELHERLDEIPQDRPIVVQCQRGARSATGAATLDAFGFSDVHTLMGGIAAWEADGHPIVK